MREAGIFRGVYVLPTWFIGDKLLRDPRANVREKVRMKGTRSWGGSYAVGERKRKRGMAMEEAVYREYNFEDRHHTFSQ